MDVLYELHKIITARVKFAQKIEDYKLLSQFTLLDRVSFKDKSGQQKEGMITSIKGRVVKIAVHEEGTWSVSPNCLTKIGGPELSYHEMEPEMVKVIKQLNEMNKKGWG